MQHTTERPIRVLYVHHSGNFGGSCRSCIEMIQGFPPDTIEPYVICPRGTALDAFRQAGIPTFPTVGISTFNHSRIGYYKGFRWLILLRELAFAAPTLLAIQRVMRLQQFDLVHINEYSSLLAGIIVHACGLPVVWHVRVLLNTDDGKLRRRLVTGILNTANSVIAIDNNVAQTLSGVSNVVIIHNGMKVVEDNYQPVDLQAHARQKLGIPNDTIVFGMVGRLLPYKGIYDFLEAARICIERGVRATFVYVGSNSRKPEFYQSLIGKLSRFFGFAKNHERCLAEKIEQYGLVGRVLQLGFHTNVSEVYHAIDVLCFPSHLEGVGRPVFEAGFYGKPSIVALNTSYNDIVLDGVTGICIPQRDPVRLAEAMQQLAEAPDLRKHVGEAARKHCLEHFDRTKTAVKVLEIYRQVISER